MVFIKGLKQKLVSLLYKRLLIEHFKHKEINHNKLLKRFNCVGANFRIGKDNRFIGHENISFGDNFSALDRLRIEAISSYNDQTFSPGVQIGNNVCFNTDVHIGCINKVVIKDNCLLASRIFITDHFHGETNKENLAIYAIKRPLFSKGPVIIEENVWIGEGVTIMPNVVIGKNSVIGANAVVTKSIPNHSIVGGIPAKILK